jgi:hypothetical protein
VHVEHGHAPGCARLAGDQAAEDQRRHEQVPGPILHSEPAAGPVQRHWLRERITDDCPRCGWRGYFHHYLATVDGDWAAAVCDNCYAVWLAWGNGGERLCEGADVVAAVVGV